VLIYRIEKPSGEGPYRESWCCRQICDRLRHPTPNQDSGLSEFWLTYTGAKSELYFGFGTMEQMRAWFHQDDWLMDLHDFGFQLAIYEIDDEPDDEGYVDVCVGHTQAVFRRKDAELRSAMSLKDLVQCA
jgi:hypothetical protein